MKITLFILLLSTLQNLTVAQEIELPVIQKPSVLEEGVQRELTEAQMAELLPWAKNSKMFLSDLLEGIQGLSTAEKIERLQYGIKQATLESAPKNTELLMRYALNRAVVLNEILSKEMDEFAVGTQDTKLRILISSVKMALNYYKQDINVLSKKGVTDFETFGVEYFKFLYEINKSIFDASAQYTVQKIGLEWLQWDLYRDLNNAQHAPKIFKINSALKMFPLTTMSDAQYIKSIQQMKKVSQQLEILNYETRIDRDARLKKEEEEAKERSSSNNVRKNKYYYSTDYNACYKKSFNNDIMWGDKVSNLYCESSPMTYYYSTDYNACYKNSFNNDIMWADKVSNSFCERK